MIRSSLYIIAVFISFHAASQENSVKHYRSEVWVADLDNGNYKNPVIHADYSDPDVIRVNNDYYMIASSFNHVPGLPILHSKDLVNWQLIGHALRVLPPREHFSKVQHGNGVWAPAIRFHKNEFYIYYPDPDFGIYLIRSKNITGPWTEPELVQEGRGLIDPCPLWDEDGKAYLVHAYAGSRAGIKSIIVIRQMNPEGTKTIDDGVIVYDGHEKDPTIEGPKLYRRNGYYYIFAPAGGVSTGWQLVLRSKNIYGPYERKVVMDQGNSSINGPHQGAWISTQTGENWFIHFQDKESYGRVVHLQPMQWKNDWPVIGVDKDGDGTGEPVTQYKKPNTGKVFPAFTPAESDEFNTRKIGLQWQWQANPQHSWAIPTAEGSLRMFSVHQPDSVKSLWNTSNLLGQKLPAETFTATVRVSIHAKTKNERFGFGVFGTDYAYISLEKTEEGISIVCRKNQQADKNGKETEFARYPVSGTDLFLRIRMEPGGRYRFLFSLDGLNFTRVDELCTAKPGRWVGAKLVMFCLRDQQTNDAGYTDIDWFRIEH
jgi:beta-xylosidase